MNANLERKLPHLRQFFNIVFGFSIGVLILSLPAPETFQWQTILTSMVLFLFLGMLVVHAWWRQADMMSTTRLMKADTWLILFLRLFLVYTLVYWMRTLAITGVSHFWGWTALFVNATLLYALSTVQQLIALHPLYGKNRVMQRREVITDSLLTLISALYVVGLIFYSEFFMSWQGGIAALLAIGGVRPIAKAMTVWKELPPPHRGGRRAPETSSERAKRQQQQRSSSRSNRQSSSSGSSSGASSRKVVSARNLREDKSSQKSSRQQNRRERRGQQSGKSAEKAAADSRKSGETRQVEKAAEKEKAPSPEPARQPEKTEPVAGTDKPDTAAAIPSQQPEPEARVDLTGTGLPDTAEHEAPARSEAEPSKPEEETPKAMYGRRPAKKGPDLPDLDEVIKEEDVESMDSAIADLASATVSLEGKEVSYGRKPRRKQPELLEELSDEESTDAQQPDSPEASSKTAADEEAEREIGSDAGEEPRSSEEKASESSKS